MAETAPRDSDSWETDYAAWPQLVKLTKALLTDRQLVPEETLLIAVIIGLPAEGEDIADWIKAHRRDVPNATIQALASSPDPGVRWQIYDSLDGAEEWSRMTLLRGIEDNDPYVRRRAFLRLVSHEIPARHILQRAASDSDIVTRELALKLLGAPD